MDSTASSASNFKLIRGNGAIDTGSCGTLAGNDTLITIDSASYDSGSNTTTLSVNGGSPLPSDSFRLCALKSLLSAGAALHLNDPATGGVEGPGSDFARNFSIIASDVAAAKTNNVGGSVLLGSSFNWTVTITTPGAGADATFASGQTIL